MSRNRTLYVKGMDEDSFQDSEDDGNAWDDRKLNAAYDKAMKIANLEVAKRIAMATNTQMDKGSKQTITNGKKKQQSITNSKKKKWTVGMLCKALYDEDGLEYEGHIISIINDRECIIQFAGYDNLQKVELNSLVPVSQDEANNTKYPQLDRNNSFENQAQYDDVDLPETTYNGNSRSSNNRKIKQTSGENSFTLPDMPMPDMAMIRSLGGMDLPFPPPPPELGAIDNEQQAVTTMLISWYMSGYYTGVYQGMKKAQEDNLRKGK